MDVTVELEDRDVAYLRSFYYLRVAEGMNEDPEAPTTLVYDYLPPDVEARVVDALVAEVGLLAVVVVKVAPNSG